MKLHKPTAKSIQVKTSQEIVDLAKELNFSLDLNTARKVIRLGIESLNREAEVKLALKKLEEEKERLASSFQKIALQNSQLEAKCIGTRSQFGKVSRDNRVLAMHLCARTLRSMREERLRKELVRKYIMNYRSA